METIYLSSNAQKNVLGYSVWSLCTNSSTQSRKETKFVYWEKDKWSGKACNKYGLITYFYGILFGGLSACCLTVWPTQSTPLGVIAGFSAEEDLFVFYLHQNIYCTVSGGLTAAPYADLYKAYMKSLGHLRKLDFRSREAAQQHYTLVCHPPHMPPSLQLKCQCCVL